MISVLIPVYNQERYLAEAIESVCRQTYSDVEIIVVDDGSTDATAIVAQTFANVRYVYQKHGGVSIARNRALREAHGEYIAFLDADDVYDETKLKKQIGFLESNPDCMICYTATSNFTDIPEDKLSRRQNEVKRANVREILPSALIRWSTFETCGFFDVGLKYGEDTEWIERIRKMGLRRTYVIEEALYYRRIHENNLSLNHEFNADMDLNLVLATSSMHAIMMKSGRKISVIIPAYNAAKYIDDAVQSVYRQNWLGEVELIIVDNNSTDDTCEVALKYNCRLLHEEQKGAAYARNKGIAAATGDFVVLLDADDYLTDGAADALFKPMYGAKSADAVFAKAVDFISPELTEGERSRLIPREEAYAGVLPGCSIIRRNVFDKVGMFDTSLSSGETVDWMMRLKEHTIPTVQIDSVVLQRRLHMTNTGRVSAQDELKNYAALLRKRMMKK